MGIFTECARCEQLRDEIKSLRGLLEKTEMRDILDRDFIPFESIGLLFQLLRQHREEWRKLIAERDAEIERLREQITRLSTLVDTERSLHDAEIEQLRYDLGLERHSNERLRAEVALRKAQQSRYPFCQDHRDKVRGLPCRECEIDRLRGLLREAPKHPMTESLKRRVREALGG